MHENSCIQFINHYLTLLNQNGVLPNTSTISLPPTSSCENHLSLPIPVENRHQAIRILLNAALIHTVHILIIRSLTSEISISIYSNIHQFQLVITSVESESRLYKSQLGRGFTHLRTALLKRTRITPIVGPDGSGKTAMLEELKNKSLSSVTRYRFKNLIRHNFLYQVSRLWLLKRAQKEMPVDIKKAAVKDYYDDIKGAWVIWIGAVYYPFLALKMFFSRGFLFVDRFFHDFIIQNSRFNDRDSKLRANWQNLLKRTPDTYWFLHLDAPNHIILSRKQELSEQAISAYRDCMFEMYIQKPSPAYSYINTELPINNCVETIRQMGQEIGYNL